ncbi:MAG: hypothetical protein AB1405_01590 [Bdellovibrionota bacterium]
MIKEIIVFPGKSPPVSEGVQCVHARGKAIKMIMCFLRGWLANHSCKFSGNPGDLGYLGHLGIFMNTF